MNLWDRCTKVYFLFFNALGHIIRKKMNNDEYKLTKFVQAAG